MFTKIFEIAFFNKFGVWKKSFKTL